MLRAAWKRPQGARGRRLTDCSGSCRNSRARGQPDLQRGPRLEPQRRRQSRVRRERDGRRRWLVWRVRRHGRRPKSNRPGRAAASRAGRAAAGRPREPDHARRRRRDALGARQWRQVLRRGRACDEAAAQAVAGIQAGRLRGAAAQGAAAQGAGRALARKNDAAGASASTRRRSRPACRRRPGRARAGSARPHSTALAVGGGRRRGARRRRAR